MILWDFNLKKLKFVIRKSNVKNKAKIDIIKFNIFTIKISIFLFSNSTFE